MKKKGKKVIHRGIILFPFNLEGSCDLRSLQRLSCTKTANQSVRMISYHQIRFSPLIALGGHCFLGKVKSE